MTLRYNFKTQPYAHQLRALNKIDKLGGKAGLFLPMRTGKTKTAIDWAGIAYHNYGLRRVLIVCPIAAIDVWVREIETHCPVPSVKTILRDTAAKNAQRLKDPAAFFYNGKPISGIHWVIVNYEMVWRYATKSIRLDEFLGRWQPDLVIADEAHKLKNPTSQQSKALMRLAKSARMRLALTGTPVTKAPLDLFGQFRFINDEVFPKTWADFKDRYADWEPARWEPRIKVVKHYKNLDDLVSKVRANSFRMTLRDAFPDLPDKVYETIRTPLPQAARRVYDEMAQEMISFLEGGQVATADIVLEKLVRLQQVTSGFIKDEQGIEVELPTAKLDALWDLVQDVVEQDEKLVVFCRFKHDYHSISSRLHAGGISHRLLTGEQTDRQKADAIQDFQNDRNIPVFVAQTQSGSLGIKLDAARMACFYSLGYNWAEYVQAQDRILDVQRNVPLGIYHLIAPSTIDVTMLRVLRKRGNVAEALIHNPRMLLDGSADDLLL